MDIECFVKRATHHEREVKPVELRTIVQSASSLAQAREEMRKFVWNQAVADRILQEFVLEDDSIDRHDFAEQMPLIEPRSGSNTVSPNHADDLGPVGEVRHTIRESPDEEKLQIIQQKYEFVGLHDDGTAAAHWKDIDSISISKEKLPELKATIEAYLYASQS